MSRNPRLEGTVEPVLEQTRRQFEENEEKQREFGEFRYQAKTWKYSRRVVAKVEVNEVGINRRFVVTNRADLSPRPLYDHYSDRGQTENYIKASTRWANSESWRSVSKVAALSIAAV